MEKAKHRVESAVRPLADSRRDILMIEGVPYVGSMHKIHLDVRSQQSDYKNKDVDAVKVIQDLMIAQIEIAIRERDLEWKAALLDLEPGEKEKE